MKSLDSTPSSSAKSSTTIDSETRDSCYFPGCRKDANCKCEICIASINATLDLMPKTIQRNSLGKPSARGNPRCSPVLFDPSSFSTPRSSRNPSAPVSPPSNSSASASFLQEVERDKKEYCGFGAVMVRFLVGLSLVFVVEYGVSSVVSGVFEPELSLDVVRKLSEKSWVSNDLNERLMIFRNEMEKLVDDEVSNCSSSFYSQWKVNQDGLLLNSRCTLIESITEEVSIWGWPLQTAGLLTAGYSSRSFTLLSGRLTEWSNGETSYKIMNVNSSWTQRKWSSSAVQLDPNTWILEYNESPIRENARFVSAVVEFLKFRFTREFEMLKQKFKSQQSHLRGGNWKSFHVPT
ncbi:PREDICTED: uncharacterized protein LOC109163828 [Ipomoea nil]|uniref:uncharacterized protein LOC109163828 n=1 Tax=Ipomoea nil TaxID=35883 RepID=UPI000901C905|nr:PREDICTED: uncharacterized protein LOC109163828 [Ipomoea nil]